MGSDAATLDARRIQVQGIVQGVGFRPFVAGLAVRFGVTGWVRNDGGSVTIHAEAAPDVLDAFAAAIRTEAPPLALVESVASTATPRGGHTDFAVDPSIDTDTGPRLAPPDAATCTRCLEELFDPMDRRFAYPFINCTNCGPRFTIITALPYDRGNTSMRGFEMCPDCRREYEDPADRRYHAEPIACPTCGPRLRLVDGAGHAIAGDPVVLAAELLRSGSIVAVKGLGGFQLACDALDDRVVHELRTRKRRPEKPFAVMVRDMDEARRRFDPSEVAEAALGSWRAPIVLLDDRGTLAPAVAPGHRRQGAMLPSTPVHHLLVRAAGIPLVMTSGNVSDEPICIEDDDALRRLAGIADAFLVHDRPIVARYDDSVLLVRTGGRAATVLRRARSEAPQPLPLARAVPRTVLGTGAELHGAFCIIEGDRAYLSQHIGDLDAEAAMDAYRDAYDRYRRVFRTEPELVAHDLHPDLMTTRFAETLGLPRIAVQHHHAHVATTMAEHGLEDEVLGIAMDGLGLGEDGTIWGGELLRCTPARAVRVGRLRPVRQPGGDAATRHPWRMAVSHAADAGVVQEALPFVGIADGDVEVVLGQIRSGLASPSTSSAGRLFDAVAALLGICRHASYDGQAAGLLEQAALLGRDRVPIRAAVGMREGLLEIDPREVVRWIVAGRAAGAPTADLARGFHTCFAEAVARACTQLSEGGQVATGRVALGGGVFQNDLFTTDLRRRLTGAGFEVFLPRRVPVGDGGIALGQAYVAAARGA